MKKVFVWFIVLVVLGGAAFFFGWAQFPVPPGAYGVLRSKTHGVDPEVIREGRIRWVWHKLIPLNATTLVFAPNRVNALVAADGTLPLAATYAEKTGIAADFSWSIEADLSFAIKPGVLPSLTLTRGLADQAALEEYERSLAREIDFFARERLASRAAREQFAGEETPWGDLRAASERLEGEIGEAFAEVENVSFLVRKVRMPDFALYATARSLYGDYLDRQRELLRAEIAEQAELGINARRRFEELEKYGELITKYPALLQYLELIGPGQP